jgi:hypothetical protein
MTHTLHRRGQPSDLCDDHILLVMPARGVNLEGSGPAMREVWRIIARYDDELINYGNLTAGNRYRTSLEEFQRVDSRLIHAVFRTKAALEACLADLKAGDLGPSVVVTDVRGDAFEMCEKAGISPHTVNLSLGLHGRTDRLPPEPVLEITTMCGHALVASDLVMEKVAMVREGRETAAEAAEGLALLCECGIFNTARAQRLIRRLAEQPVSES